MTFERGFPQRLTAIDDLTRGDHWYLREGDVCHFIGEYTARKGSAYGATNTLILDFKMSVLNDGLPVWRHKEAAIATAAAVLFEAEVSPSAREGFDALAFCAGLTPELAARALRGIADGVFPSLMWDDVQYHMDLDEWVNRVLGGLGEDQEAPLSGVSG